MLELPVPKGAIDACSTDSEDSRDETLEVLMTDLNEENAKQFYLDHASAVAEGRFYEQAHQARIEAQEHLGDISTVNSTHGNLQTWHCRGSPCGSEDEFDVFSNTSSDNGELFQDPGIDYPAELTTEGHALGTVVSESCGLVDVYPTAKYPDARIDAYLFTPCGFSANGVVPASNGVTSTHYFSVHVTPEPHCSYASFETNVPSMQTGREIADAVEQVIGIFKPGRFSVTLFQAQSTNEEDDNDEQGRNGPKVKANPSKKFRKDQIRGYRRVDRIVHDLDGYELVFKYYERFDWEGGAPRLGEVF